MERGRERVIGAGRSNGPDCRRQWIFDHVVVDRADHRRAADGVCGRGGQRARVCGSGGVLHRRARHELHGKRGCQRPLPAACACRERGGVECAVDRGRRGGGAAATGGATTTDEPDGDRCRLAVTLSWNAPTTGGVPTAYHVEAGSWPGASDLTVFSTETSATSYSAIGVANGTYYLRVRASERRGTECAVKRGVGAGRSPAAGRARTTERADRVALRDRRSHCRGRRQRRAARRRDIASRRARGRGSPTWRASRPAVLRSHTPRVASVRGPTTYASAR